MSLALGDHDMTITPEVTIHCNGLRLVHKLVSVEGSTYVFRVDKSASNASYPLADYEVYELVDSGSALASCSYSEAELKTDLKFCREAGAKYARVP